MERISEGGRKGGKHMLGRRAGGRKKAGPGKQEGRYAAGGVKGRARMRKGIDQ